MLKLLGLSLILITSCAHKPFPTETKSAPVQTTVSHAHAEDSGISPQDALAILKKGNDRYLKGSLRTDGATASDRDRLSTGQKPHTIVLSCSDSRVPPELLFDQRLGELFVVRTAGETLSPQAIGSIEYAVEHLGSRLILVMGHSSCGAVKAAFGTLSGGSAGSNNLDELVRDIHPRIQTFKGHEASGEFINEAWSNVRGVELDLISRSEILKKARLAGHIKIAGALYHLKSGIVDFE